MNTSRETAQLIKSVAKQRKVVVKAMLDDLALNKNTLSSMTSRGSWLQADSLAKIADYLDCSVDYLLGRTDNPQSHKNSSSVSVGNVSGNSGAIGIGNTVNAQSLDEHQKLLIELYHKLSLEEQIDLIYGLKNKSK